MTTPKTVKLADHTGKALTFTRKSEKPHDNGSLCEYSCDDPKLACSVVIPEDSDEPDTARAIALQLARDAQPAE